MAQHFSGISKFFVFGSIGVCPRVVGSVVNDQKKLQLCLMLVIVFLVCFTEIDFLVFPKKMFLFLYGNNFFWHYLFSDQLGSNHVLLTE